MPNRRIVGAIMALAAIAACKSGSSGAGGAGANAEPGAPTPRAAVERFLAAVRAQDLQAMSMVWGTKSGPARDNIQREQLEKREVIMTQCLANDSASFSDESPGLGGDHLVHFVLYRGPVQRSTAFTTQSDGSARWYVKEIDLKGVHSCTAKPASSSAARRSRGGTQSGLRGLHLCQLDEYAARGTGVHERNALPLGAHAWHLVDEPDPRRPAPFERGTQIGCREAHMVDARTAPRDELVDRAARDGGLEEFDQCITCCNRGNPGPIRVIDGNYREAKDVAVEWKSPIERLDRDPNVRDTGRRAGRSGGRSHRVVDVSTVRRDPARGRAAEANQVTAARGSRQHGGRS